MVHLTFVRCADLNAYGSISLAHAKALFLLSKLVVEKCGKPQMLYASGNDEALVSAKVLNLSCSIHGIVETSALNHKASSSDTRAFVDYLEKEATLNKVSHILLVCTHEAFAKIFHKTPVFANTYTLCAPNWDNILLNYHEIWSPFATDDDVSHPLDEVLKLPCSAHDALLIEKTLHELSHAY